MKRNIILLLAAIILSAGLFVTDQKVFAGDPNCQSGSIKNPYNNKPALLRPEQEQRKFAAAQTRNARNQTPTQSGGGLTEQSGFSFFASISVLLGGIWVLLILLRQHFKKLGGKNQVRPAKIWEAILKPSVALSAFGFLFLATIIGGVLTKPTAVTAGKREKPNKSLMTGVVNPANKPVFKTTQQIGGDGITQIGSPVFDAAGNRYVRGGFTGTLTVGATTLTATRDFDLFVAKYDANGTPIWVRQGSGATNGVTDTLAVEGATALAVDADGNFVWAKEFGGIGESIALDGSGRVYISGTFYDGAPFGEGTPNADMLASFGGVDLFVARYEANGDFGFAKAIAGAGLEGEIAIGNPSASDGKTENRYNPLGIAYNPARGTIFVAGDFGTEIALDCTTLTANATSIHSYLAELSADGEAVACRIWNGLDADDNNWDSTDNWNGGIVPGDYDSVYIPYTGNSFDNPTYNPAGIGSIINNLTVSDDRILTLERDLVLTRKLWLTGGIIDAGADRLLDLTDTATTNRTADADGFGGYVIGKIRKDFGTSLAPFTFPVGTANGYSPVDVNPQDGIGASLRINAVEQPQPLFASSANRINRYWNITKAGKGFLTANLTFHYLQTDVVGDESQLKLFKVEDNEAMQQIATIDTQENTATVAGVSSFSDWTLAQPLAPTAANATVSGRIMDTKGRGIALARVKMTDNAGNIRTAATNPFGFYRFDNVATGANYIFDVTHKQFTFPRMTRVQSVNGDENINFIAVSAAASKLINR